MKKMNVVRSTYHPVVKTYMDVIQQGIERAGYETSDVDPKQAQNLKKTDYLVTDSPLVAIRYIVKGFKNHVVWYQGVSPEESFMANNSHIRFFLLSKIEKWVLKRAGLVFFVSDAMREHYEKKYKLTLSEKSMIMPCFNENGMAKRAVSAEKYKKNTFVYVGSLHVWQCFEQTAKLYAEIEKAAGGNTTFYVFTGEQEKAKRILQQYGAKNYYVDYVPADVLSQRIKDMKYGFVLRQDHPVNNVATPTKFSNYLSNGIIPIYSDCLRSFAEYDAGLKLGIVCNLEDIEACVARIREHMEQENTAEEIQAKCEKAFAEYYNREAYVEKIAEKVRELAH